MAFLERSDDYLAGIGAIDHDHKILSLLVNRLHNEIKGARGENAVGEALDGLIAYVATHFAREEQYREEQYMDKRGYPELVQHAKITASSPLLSIP